MTHVARAPAPPSLTQPTHPYPRPIPPLSTPLLTTRFLITALPLLFFTLPTTPTRSCW